MLTVLVLVGAFIWVAILAAPWRPWSTREVLHAAPGAQKEDLSSITVLIPARDEAEVIGATLAGVALQGNGIHVVLVDDQSTDGTSRVAQETAGVNLLVVHGQPPLTGWSGKLWALDQGLEHVHTDLVLLLDADIELKPGVLSALKSKMREGDLDFISIMASLRMHSFWERLLMPAFIYFFKLLYPFRLSNSRFPWVAAAAGGCILMKTEALKKIGGFHSVKGRLIDDCALAGQVKKAGYKTWIGLSHAVCSIRVYKHLDTIWNMVARTAFNQLRYSIILLLLCSLIMVVLFWVPAAGLLFSGAAMKGVSLCALLAMIATYFPVLTFYGFSRWWALLLPLVGTLFLAMTWTSAIRFWQGKGSEWKGRAYGQ